MKKSLLYPILLGLLWLLPFAANSQGFSSDDLIVLDLAARCHRKEGGEFTPWKFYEARPAAIIDYAKQRIDLHNADGNRFRILSREDEGINDNGDQYYIFKVIDEEGIYCDLSMVFEEGNGEVYVHLYAVYSNITLGFLLVRTD